MNDFRFALYVNDLTKVRLKQKNRLQLKLRTVFRFAYIFLHIPLFAGSHKVVEGF